MDEMEKSAVWLGGVPGGQSDLSNNGAVDVVAWRRACARRTGPRGALGGGGDLVEGGKGFGDGDGVRGIAGVSTVGVVEPRGEEVRWGEGIYDGKKTGGGGDEGAFACQAGLGFHACGREDRLDRGADRAFGVGREGGAWVG